MNTSTIATLPSRSGVYLFLDRQKRVIYVGKAKNLRSRVRSYFQEHADLGPRKERMIREVHEIESISTDSELEAFILEATLIKRHKPRYNITLRDDKNYPYLCLSLKDPWPAIRVARRPPRDGSTCFGPYVPAAAMWETLGFIRRTFPIRTCSRNLSHVTRPCVEFQMKRCLGPCSGQVDAKTYRKAVEDVRRFLRGERKELLESLTERMNHASDALDYEKAAELRDRIAKIERALESQKVISRSLGDIDVFGISREQDLFCVKVLFIRGGALVGAKGFVLRGHAEDPDEEILASAVAQFYAKQFIPPAEVMVPVSHPSLDLLSRWLSDRAERSVRVVVAPRSGKRRDLLRLAQDNARSALVHPRDRESDPALAALAREIGLEMPPDRIDGFDISTLSGHATVASRVTWTDGSLDTEGYRRFHIRSLPGPDDFAAMAEVVRRCYRDHALPDLILIDGGRGQLEAAISALPSGWQEQTFPVALAKQREGRPERLYLPGRTDPIYLDPLNPSTRLLQKIRDEAHRYAVTFHRKTRTKESWASVLESVPGIGRVRRLALLRAFGSVQDIRNASLEELLKVKGMDRSSAQNLIEALSSKKGSEGVP